MDSSITWCISAFPICQYSETSPLITRKRKPRQNYHRTLLYRGNGEIKPVVELPTKWPKESSLDSNNKTIDYSQNKLFPYHWVRYFPVSFFFGFVMSLGISCIYWHRAAGLSIDKNKHTSPAVDWGKWRQKGTKWRLSG